MSSFGQNTNVRQFYISISGPRVLGAKDLSDKKKKKKRVGSEPESGPVTTPESERLTSPSHVRLCDPTDCSPPGSSVHGILQVRILEWLAMPFSRGSSRPGIKPRSPALQANSLPSEPPGPFSLVLRPRCTCIKTQSSCSALSPYLMKRPEA